MITHLEVSNFKSFKHIEVDFDKFNVIIGPNSSGKSNFIQLFKFINDFMFFDLERAISKQGGAEFFCNKLIGDKEPFFLNLSFDYDDKLFPYIKDNEKKLVSISNVDYSLKIEFNDNDFKIKNENISIFCNCLKNESDEEILWEDIIYIYREKNKITPLSKNGYIEVNNLFPEHLISVIEEIISDNMLMIFSPLSSLPTNWCYSLHKLGFYDFDPKECKNLSNSFGSFELSEHGENLSTFLHFTLSNDENKRKFINLINSVLPFVEDINSEKVVDSFIFNISEKYSNKLEIPSPFISDGTSVIFAFICLLYFERINEIIFIEEPERNIHPSLFSNVVQMMVEVKEDKQIFMTTHNPEILNHIPNDDIYIISRDEEGFSAISKINDSSLKEFVEMMGIGEVVINGLL